METWLSILMVIVLAMGMGFFLANNPTMQLPGQPNAMLPGKISGPAESAGLSISPGLPQRDFK